MPALLRHPQARVLPESWEPTDRGEPWQFLDEPSNWKFTFFEKGDIYGTEQEKQELAEEQQNVFEDWDTEPDYSGRKEEIFRVLSWKYDYEKATMLPTKVSISEIKRRYQAEVSGEEAKQLLMNDISDSEIQPENPPCTKTESNLRPAFPADRYTAAAGAEYAVRQT